MESFEDYVRCSQVREEIMRLESNEMIPIDWPDNVKLYQAIEEKQILFSEASNCLYIQAFLRMCDLKYSLVEKHNAEDMAPSQEIPVLKCGTILVSGINKIVQFVETKGVSLTKNLKDFEKCEIRAYASLANMTLSNAANFLTWIDEETFVKVTSNRFSSVFPWPLNKILLRRKFQVATNRLEALGWLNKDFEEVCEEVDSCLCALSQQLEEKKYFFGNKPTELDALVFAHIYTILNTPMPKTQFAEAVLKYRNIIQHCQTILDEYFSEYNTSHKFADLLKSL